MNIIILTIFVCILMLCVITQISILYALVFGYILFALYSLKKGFAPKEILKMSYKGIITAKNILVTFILIGVITALWRASGTIPAIVCYSTGIINPDFFCLATFLLNCLVSFLTGTAFGTAATMGSICMTMAYAMNLNPAFLGGAVLSGVYFGDRCSPMSTSALLVAEITKTDIYENIKNMLKTAAVPFAASSLIYLLYGFVSPGGAAQSTDVCDLFAAEFEISFPVLIPAFVMLILSVAKVNVKITMIFSILISAIICLFVQDFSISDILKFSVSGFSTENKVLKPIISGGGIISMVRVAAIVCISSCYSEIFKKTGLLEPLKVIIQNAKNKCSAYAVILTASVVSSMAACNQTLSIMLTEQLCSHIETDKNKMAIYLENSAVVIAPLVPWSIACNVPLITSGAPMISVVYAFFLFLLPLFELIVTNKKRNWQKRSFNSAGL